MSKEGPARPGLLHSLRHLVDTGLEIVQTRIQLIIVEAQEERTRLIELAVIAAVGLITGTVGAFAITAAIILAFPPGWRGIGALVLGLIYLSAAAFIFSYLHRRLKHCPPPFSESLGQIKKDREWLTSQH